MLGKILFRNFVAHRNNYFVYAMATSLAVMIYIIFFLLNQNSALNKVEDWNTSFKLLTQLINGMLLIFEFVFVTYISGIFINERTKKFKLYNYLGISKYQIGTGIFLETVIIQMFSWLLGLVMAIIFAKLFGMILMKIIGGSNEFHLQINNNLIAIFKTMLNFILLTAAINFIRIIRIKNKNKKVLKSKIVRYLLGILGILMVTYGYFLAVINKQIIFTGTNYPKIYIYMILIFLLVSVGTYLFYLGFVSYLSRTLNATSWIKYNGKRKMIMFYFNKAVRRNVSSLWLITIVSGLALVFLTAAAWVFQGTRDTEVKNYPYDIAVSQNLYPEVNQILKNDKIKIENIIKIQTKKSVAESKDNLIQPLTFISRSQYYKAMTKKGLKLNDELANNDILRIRENDSEFLTNNNSKDNKYELPSGKQITVTKHGSAFLMANTLFYGDIIVLPDKEYASISSRQVENIYGIAIKEAKDKQLFKDLLKLKKSKQYADDVYIYNRNNVDFDVPWKKDNNSKNDRYSTYTKKNLEVKYYNVMISSRIRGYMLYMLIILSIVFIIALASILSIKQFSENTNNFNDYQILRKIGVNKSELGKLVYYQTGLLFYSPMILAALHSFFALNFLYPILKLENLIGFLIILSGYLIVYTLLFIATAQISANQIKNNIN